MKSKIVYQQQGQRTFVIVFDTGDEFMSELTQFAKDNDIADASLTAIGAFSNATLGYFDIEKKDYTKIPVNEQVEVLSLVGDIALEKGEPKLHAHVVVGTSDGTARGGHIMSAHVRPTLEVVLEESPSHLHRVVDAETGLALISL